MPGSCSADDCCGCFQDTVSTPSGVRSNPQDTGNISSSCSGLGNVVPLDSLVSAERSEYIVYERHAHVERCRTPAMRDDGWLAREVGGSPVIEES